MRFCCGWSSGGMLLSSFLLLVFGTVSSSRVRYSVGFEMRRKPKVAMHSLPKTAFTKIWDLTLGT
jgi:hypothetical protein